MKKYYQLPILCLVSCFISSKAFSQSVLIIDNPDTKPVPVKVVNPGAAEKVKIPFTLFSSVVANNALVLSVAGSSDTTKVIEYVYASGVAANVLTMNTTIGGKTYEINHQFPVLSGLTQPYFSTSMNIVLRQNDKIIFNLLNGSDGKRFILVSGYYLK